MTEELIKRLTALKICTECQIKGKPCDDDCKWQYEAGNMGEIVQTLEQTIKALEREPFMNKPCVSNEVCEHDKMQVLDKIRAEIDKLPDLNPDYEMDKTIHVSKWAVFDIIDKYRKAEE